MLLKLICATTLISILFDEVKCYNDKIESSKHGGNGGTEFKIVCPYNGAITGIKYRSALKIHQLLFICTSSMGETTFGPYGGDGGSAGSIRCPKGHYISSFYGKSYERLDRLGIRCRPENDMTSNGLKFVEFGGLGGSDFNDMALSIGARPISVLVRADSEVDSIQITYANITLAPLCTDCSKYQEEWALKHGGEGGVLHSFVCPEQGVLTGITIQSSFMVNSVQFVCTSSSGESTFGPYGKVSGNKFTDKCPTGSYIGSIYGKSASKVDKLGIRCVKVGQAGGSPMRDAHGGNGGSDFDDKHFSTKGFRPIEIRIWSESMVNAIQIKYGNAPVALNCSVERIEVVDESVVAQPDGIEVIGIASGSTCSSAEHKLLLNAASSVSDSVSIERTDGGEFNWQSSVSIGITTGVSIGAKSEVSIDLTQSLGGSTSWSHSRSQSTTTTSEKGIGTEIGYQGPGASIAIGYLNRFKIKRDNVPVLYHFQCEAGELTPQTGKIKLSSTTFGKAHFDDYQFQFKDLKSCTSAARSCVAGLRSKGFISDPKDLQNAFNKCFPADAGTYL